MQHSYAKIQGAGLGLAAISYDSAAILKNFAGRQQISFPLLSDVNAEIIERYGILNTTVAKNSPTYGIPYPGIYVLDRQGIVTGKFFEDDYRERDTAAVILMKQFGISMEAAATAVPAKHLTLSASASGSAVHAGEHILLTLEAELPKGVHVYAPGVTGYIPIEWKAAESPGIKQAPVQYPQAKTMRLEAIKETVPVFEGRFRLAREITIGSDKEVTPLLDSQRELTIEGSFRYQACDERTCYLPETLPLKWVVQYDPLDRVRAPKEMQRQAR